MQQPAQLTELRFVLERAATDPSVDATQRVAGLRALRADLVSLVGDTDRYLADQESQREAEAIGRQQEGWHAREGADVRGVLLDQMLAAPEVLDGEGLLSHDELDRRQVDGTLQEGSGVRELASEEVDGGEAERVPEVRGPEAG